ncbi:MAG: DoxX family protein [Acidobacteriaceae bacterium]
MKYVLLVSRLLLGLILLVLGANNILHFLHAAPPTGDALTWFGIMATHGWISVAGVIMIISGLLLLVGRFVPLALTLFAPILVNILLYHALLWPHGYIPAIIATLLELILLIAYHRSFASLFAADPTADTPKL